MAMKAAKKKKKAREALARAQESKKQATQNMYNNLFKYPSFSEMQADYEQRYNDMTNNLSYSTDDTVYKQTVAKQQSEINNIPTVVDFEMEKLKAMRDFEYTDNEKVNMLFDKQFEDGSTYEDMRAFFNRAYDNKDLTQEEWAASKRALEHNEDFIRNYEAPLRGEVMDSTSSQVVKAATSSTGVGAASGEVVMEIGEQATEEAVEEVAEGAAKVGNPYLKQVFSGRNLGTLMNVGFAISDYNEARNSGDGVVKSAAKAGAQFVAGEMLGAWMFPVMLAKQVPTIAVSTIEATQQMTRQMNSTSRIQTFGEAEFRDTQQLATMRQAGMEMAKMSQYNLQQSIMGNEAQYMHRL